MLDWFSKRVGTFLGKIESTKQVSRAQAVQRDELPLKLVSPVSEMLNSGGNSDYN